MALEPYLLIMFAIIPVVVWYIHFNSTRDSKRFLQISGIVRLDDQPLPRARVTFYLVSDDKLRGFIALETDARGAYVFHDVPLRSFRITVKGDRTPPGYADPARTPFAFVGDQVGAVEHNLELDSGFEPK